MSLPTIIQHQIDLVLSKEETVTAVLAHAKLKTKGIPKE